MQMSKKNLVALLGLLVIIAVFLGSWYMTRTPPVEGDKRITVQVVHGDGTTKDFPITTYAEYLGQAIQEQEGLVEGDQGPYGLYIRVVDGEADDESQQKWWCVTKGGESVMTSADTTPIADGEHYELTLMTGY